MGKRSATLVKKIKMKKIFYIVAIIIIMSSCREQLVMVPDFMPPPSERVVLIEELTGVSCPNCPVGTAKLKELKSLYGERIVIIGVHGSFLSWPTPESKYDFRNEKAADIEDYLRPWEGKPAAAVNRVQYTDELSVSTPDLWSNYIDEELEKDHVMNLLMTTEYNNENREVKIDVTVIPLIDFDLEDKLHISVAVLESEIEDAQEDPNTIIEEYEHNHVLRDMLTDFKGTPINKALTKNEAEKFSFNYIIPEADEGDELWIPEHMEIVAYVNKVNGDTKDVLQAVETKVIE